MGFSREDGETVRAWFSTMEPGFPVSHCPAAALEGTATLRQALGLAPLLATGEALPPPAAAAPMPGAGSAKPSEAGAAGARLQEMGWEAAPGGVPPVVFFSGMAGAEVVGVLELWTQGTGRAGLLTP